MTDCRVSAPKVDGDANGSDFGHQCATRPGSSGSPVLDLQNRVVGLHHFGGCTATGGWNQAVLMSKILPHLPLDVNFLSGRLACGSNGCLDTWRISCSSSHTRCVVARACADASPTDRLALTLIGQSPAALIGQGDIAAGPPGGCTAEVRVCRQGTGAMKAVMALSAPAPGAPEYAAFAGCEDRNGVLGAPDHRVVKPVTDQ